MLYNNEIFYLCWYENSDRGSYNVIENDPSIDSNNTFAQHIQVMNPITDTLKMFYLKNVVLLETSTKTREIDVWRSR